MTEYDNTNRFTLFRETDRKSDKHPEFSGSLNVDGVDYWINAWVKTSKTGSKFFSGSVKPKTPRASEAPARDFDLDDAVPF